MTRTHDEIRDQTMTTLPSRDIFLVVVGHIRGSLRYVDSHRRVYLKLLNFTDRETPPHYQVVQVIAHETRPDHYVYEFRRLYAFRGDSLTRVELALPDERLDTSTHPKMGLGTSSPEYYIC